VSADCGFDPERAGSNIMSLKLTIVLGFLGLRCLVTPCIAHDFVAVFFDDESAKTLHADTPLPRGLKAQAINRLRAAGARGLVLKFFEDLPRDEEQDREFTKALCLMPTVLQACLCTDGSTNPLPSRFWIQETNRIRSETSLSDVQGYIPLAQFNACARGVGFVDLNSARPESIPLIEVYQGHWVKSFYINALELETGQSANYSSGTNVTFGTRSLSFDKFGEHAITTDLESLDYIPFHHVLDGTVPDDRFRGKVIILGYEGNRIHAIHTRWGEIRAHRLFVQSLLALHRDLQERTK
jgi:hypothetical protein